MSEVKPNDTRPSLPLHDPHLARLLRAKYYVNRILCLFLFSAGILPLLYLAACDFYSIAVWKVCLARTHNLQFMLAVPAAVLLVPAQGFLDYKIRRYTRAASNVDKKAGRGA
ncbi:uncharacterized protein N7459_009501 [Penicillium hispanicum]|uniref:uncharacterized protein n=1 Tax=Penicillium hispanicum TaxID=1080232 RepID=UPI00253F9A27|nr:uncharacterized protein N7459_009501 [Penicillium hispanicum]KAJ5570071.1 hypothetical protein N7459_009501 [Penicillium hispanicum]